MTASVPNASQVDSGPLTEEEVLRYNYEILSRQFNVIVASVASAFRKLNIMQVDISKDEYDDTIEKNITLAVNRLPNGLNLFLLTPEQREAMEATIQ